ncbi:MAG TPA: prepilin-type N-terminal cleavage/methylation domain-containing protein [Candidatus Rifleibacterium sp.]|nr:prepilin-type N-terminal cleavage/methylation domain-containing protein [Candidatus Rifleibacterium sp.]HPT45607.1 prepilin-type N-terminal cleavage/methylation domain-containing protein [Candidatus Rifleibacterium sp.]
MMFKQKKTTAFTLVEVLIACVVMALFMTAVYQLFIGGSKTAGRAQWVSGTVDQMRNTLSLLSREIRSSTYPTTLFSDTFYDPCDNDDPKVAAEFYLRILQDGKPILPPSTGELKIMTWVVCEPEKPKNQPGKIVKNELFLDFAQQTRVAPVGNLRLVSSAFSYTTDAKNEYARSGKLNLTPIEKETRSKILVNDVQFIEFSVAGTLPPEKPVDFFPISVKIHTLYPKDEKLSKENSIMATPQVGIDTF